MATSSKPCSPYPRAFDECSLGSRIGLVWSASHSRSIGAEPEITACRPHTKRPTDEKSPGLWLGLHFLLWARMPMDLHRNLKQHSLLVVLTWPWDEAVVILSPSLILAQLVIVGFPECEANPRPSQRLHQLPLKPRTRPPFEARRCW